MVGGVAVIVAVTIEVTVGLLKLAEIQQTYQLRHASTRIDLDGTAKHAGIGTEIFYDQEGLRAFLCSAAVPVYNGSTHYPEVSIYTND